MQAGARSLKSRQKIQQEEAGGDAREVGAPCSPPLMWGRPTARMGWGWDGDKGTGGVRGGWERSPHLSFTSTLPSHPPVLPVLPSLPSILIHLSFPSVCPHPRDLSPVCPSCLPVLCIRLSFQSVFPVYLPFPSIHPSHPSVLPRVTFLPVCPSHPSVPFLPTHPFSPPLLSIRPFPPSVLPHTLHSTSLPFPSLLTSVLSVRPSYLFSPSTYPFYPSILLFLSVCPFSLSIHSAPSSVCPTSPFIHLFFPSFLSFHPSHQFILIIHPSFPSISPSHPSILSPHPFRSIHLFCSSGGSGADPARPISPSPPPPPIPFAPTPTPPSGRSRTPCSRDLCSPHYPPLLPRWEPTPPWHTGDTADPGLTPPGDTALPHPSSGSGPACTAVIYGLLAAPRPPSAFV